MIYPGKQLIRSGLVSLLPGWPPVPPRLWLTAGLLALGVVKLVFLDEIWPHTPGAGPVMEWMMLAAVLAGCCQLVVLLHGWVVGYTGPWWAKLLFRLVVMPALIGCVLVAIIAFILIVAAIL